LVDRSRETHEWWSTVWLMSPWLHLQRGETVTLSAWMRADRPNIDVRLDIQRGDEGRAVQGVPQDAEIGGYYKVGPEWQRLTLTGVLPISYKDGYRPRLCVISKPCKLWIDDVQMALGDPRDHQAAAPVELGLSSLDETTTYALGQAAKPLLEASRADGRAEPIEAVVTLTDPAGRTTERRVSVAPGKSLSLGPVEMERPGHYVIVAEGEGAGTSLTLAALRDHSGTPSPSTSPFGTHGGAAGRAEPGPRLQRADLALDRARGGAVALRRPRRSILAARAAGLQHVRDPRRCSAVGGQARRRPSPGRHGRMATVCADGHRRLQAVR
jgi:hypothetical protein